jgi:hypothetical protein
LLEEVHVCLNRSGREQLASTQGRLAIKPIGTAKATAIILRWRLLYSDEQLILRDGGRGLIGNAESEDQAKYISGLR